MKDRRKPTKKDKKKDKTSKKIKNRQGNREKKNKDCVAMLRRIWGNQEAPSRQTMCAWKGAAEWFSRRRWPPAPSTTSPTASGSAACVSAIRSLRRPPRDPESTSTRQGALHEPVQPDFGFGVATHRHQPSPAPFGPANATVYGRCPAAAPPTGSSVRGGAAGGGGVAGRPMPTKAAAAWTRSSAALSRDALAVQLWLGCQVEVQLHARGSCEMQPKRCSSKRHQVAP